MIAEPRSGHLHIRAGPGARPHRLAVRCPALAGPVAHRPAPAGLGHRVHGPAQRLAGRATGHLLGIVRAGARRSPALLGLELAGLLRFARRRAGLGSLGVDARRVDAPVRADPAG